MAVNLILKNDAGAPVEVEMIDQLGGNFKSTIDAGMAQNHSLMENSEVLVSGNVVHTVVPEDEGMEVSIAS